MCQQELGTPRKAEMRVGSAKTRRKSRGVVGVSGSSVARPRIAGATGLSCCFRGPKDSRTRSHAVREEQGSARVKERNFVRGKRTQKFVRVEARGEAEGRQRGARMSQIRGSGSDRRRSGDLSIFSRTLYQLSYRARQTKARSPEHRPATPTGLEPATSAVTGRRANQLRYGANEDSLTFSHPQPDSNRC